MARRQRALRLQFTEEPLRSDRFKCRVGVVVTTNVAFLPQQRRRINREPVFDEDPVPEVQ
jgi:hypothetical protein